MQFDEKKAASIIAAHGLSPTTLKVWKTRGAIPKRYADSDYKIPERTTNRVNDKIIAILTSGKINRAQFVKMAGLNEQKVMDCIRGKSFFTDQDVVKIRKALNTIRVEAKKFAGANDLKSPRNLEKFRVWLNETPIVISQVFSSKQISDFKLKKALYLNAESLRDVSRGLSVFILETSIPEAN